MTQAVDLKLGIEQHDPQNIDLSTIGDARIDLYELDRILYRGDSQNTLQPYKEKDLLSVSAGRSREDNEVAS